MAYSILEGTVPEVLAWVDEQQLGLDELGALADEEALGKGRSTLLEELYRRMDVLVKDAEPLEAERGERRTRIGDAFPFLFEVTRDCTIEGVAYTRGQGITQADAGYMRKLNVLVSNRTILPYPDPKHRRTDEYGFGDSPRRHPTPTYYTPTEVRILQAIP